MPTHDDLVQAALRFVGTPFHRGGRVPGAGLDSMGVVICAARVVGLEVPDSRDYLAQGRPQPLMDPVRAALDLFTDVIPDPVFGDLLLIRRTSTFPVMLVPTPHGVREDCVLRACYGGGAAWRPDRRTGRGDGTNTVGVERLAPLLRTVGSDGIRTHVVEYRRLRGLA